MSRTGQQATRRRGNLFAALGVMLLSVFAVFPIYWMIKGSFEETSSLLEPALLPLNPILDNYRDLLSNTDFGRYFSNSLTISVATTLLTVTVATIAGYGLARFSFRGQKVMARGVLFAEMFPTLALAIPLYLVFNQIQLTNTIIGLIIAHTSLSLPFGIWLMWQFFQTVPRSYQESAYTLGASKFRTFLEVETPLASPGMIVIAIFAFALSWGDYEFAFILSTDVESKTLPVGIAQFVEQDVVHWGLIQSAGFFMAIPALLIVLFLQRYLINGIGAGGIKG